MGNMTNASTGFLRNLNQMSNGLTNMNRQLQVMTSNVTNVANRFGNLNGQTRAGTRETAGYLSNLTNIMKKFSDWMLVGTLFYQPLRAFRNGIQDLKEIDTELVNIAKVTDLNNEQMQKLAVTASQVGVAFGKTASEYLQAAGLFAKAGLKENMQELTKVALLYSNTAEMDVNDATSTLISTMKGFNLESTQSINILDKMNNVSNKNAVSAQGLSNGMKNLASTANVAGLNLDQTYAILGTGIATTQKAGAEVGNALRTIFMRMQGVSDGAETMEEDISKAETALRTIGIQVRKSNGEFKPAMDTLSELADKYKNLSDVERSSVTEALAGKQRANILKSILGNFGDYQKMLTESQTAFGSAARENEKYMGSLEAKLKSLSAMWSSFWQRSIDSAWLKMLVDAGSKAVELGRRIGGLIPILTAVAIAFTAIKLNAFISQVTQTSKIAGQTIPIMEALGYRINNIGLSVRNSIGGIQTYTAVIGGIATGISLLVIAYGWWQSREAEANAAREEAINKINEETKNLDDLKNKYKELALSGNDDQNTKEQLLSIQKELIDSYKLEADGIDLVNGKYKDNIKLIDETIAKKAKEAQAKMESVASEAKETLSSKYSIGNTFQTGPKIGPAGLLGNIRAENIFGSIESDLKEVTSGMDSFTFSIKDGNLALESTGKVSNKVAKEDMQTLIERLKQLKDSGAANSKQSEYLQDMINKLSDGYNELSGKVDKANENLDKYNKYGAEATWQKDFADDASKIEEELSKLANSKEPEKIKKNIDQIVVGMHERISKSKYANQLTDFMQNITSDIAKSYAEVDKANVKTSSGIEDLTKKLEDAEKVLKSVTSTIKTLDSAVKELDDNNKLSGDTLLKLLEQYPEIAAHLTNEADLRKKLLDIQNQEVKKAQQALNTKLMLNQEFFNELIKGNKTLWDKLGSFYNNDLTKFKTLNDLKIEINKAAVEVMGEAWAKQHEADAAILDETIKALEKVEETSSFDIGRHQEIERLKTLRDTYTNFSKTLNESTKNININTLSLDTNLSKTSSSMETLADQTLLTKDRYMELNAELEKTNTLLSKNKSLQDVSKSEKDKITLLKQEILLQQQKQKQLHAVAEEERKERNEAVAYLKSKGVTFKGSGENLVATNADKIINKIIDQVNSSKGVATTSSYTSGGNTGISSGVYKYSSIVSEMSSKYNVPQNLIYAIMNAESGGNPNARSPVGAGGLLQLMPGTASGLGVTNVYDPRQNIEGGTKYLKQMLDTFGGNLQKSIAAYNAGPGNVQQYGGIPPFAETQAYVKKVMSTMGNVSTTTTSKNKDASNAYKTEYEKIKDAYSRFIQIQTKDIGGLQQNWYDAAKAIEETRQQIEQLRIEELQKQFESFDKSIGNVSDRISDIDSQISLLKETDFDNKIKLIGQQFELTERKQKSYTDELNRLKRVLTESANETQTINDRIFELSKQFRAGEIAIKGYIDSLKGIMTQQKDLAQTYIESYKDSITKSVDEQIAKLDEMQKQEEKISDARIKDIETQLDLLQKQDDAKKQQEDREKRLLDIEKQKKALLDAQTQKDKKVYRTGIGWVYEADQTKIKQETEKLQELEKTNQDKEDEITKNAQIKSLENEKQAIEDHKKLRADFYNDDKTKLQNFLNNENKKWDEFGKEQITSKEILLTKLSELDAASYVDRLTLLNGFIADYNTTASGLNLISIDKTQTVSDFGKIVDTTLSEKIKTEEAKTPPQPAITDQTMVYVNKGVAGQKVLESIGSVEARQKIRYDAAIKQGNQTLANTIKNETSSATGRPAPFKNEGYTGSWRDGTGKLALVHPEEFILNKQTVSNMLSGNINSMIGKVSGLNPNIKSNKSIENISKDMNVSIGTMNVTSDNPSKWMLGLKNMVRKR